MPKKAQLPPGAAGRSQQTLARRNRRDALGKWLRRYALLVDDSLFIRRCPVALLRNRRAAESREKRGCRHCYALRHRALARLG